MQTNLSQVFNFNFRDKPIRIIELQDEPWFVASDVCDALDIANARDALSRLDDDEKGVGLTDTLGGTQEVSIINEPGLYSLVLSSRKPEAKPFKRWVTHQVLPELRRKGFYGSAAYTVRPYGSYHPEAHLTPEEKKTLLAVRKDWQEIYDMVMRGMNSMEIGDKLGRDDSGVRYIVRRMRRSGVLPPDPRKVALALERKLIALTKKEESDLH